MAEGAGHTVDSTIPGTAASDDWVVQAADTIERVVGTVRDKTAVPLDKAARVVVYGLLAGLLGAAAAVLLAIAAVRALDVALGSAFGVEVWAAHAVVGGIFTLAGLFLWSKRERRAEP